MATAKQKIKIALFVLGSLFIAILAIIVIGGNKFFSSSKEFVLYFADSITGLQVGSPVVFRGVALGSVSRITIEIKDYDNPIVPVYIRLNEEVFANQSDADWFDFDGNMDTTINAMVQNGLKAQLQVQSLVTGQVRVVLNFEPDYPAKFYSSTPGNEIPTMPSISDQLSKTLSSVSWQELFKSVQDVLNSTARLVNSSKISNALDAITGTFLEATTQLKKIDTLINEAQNSLNLINRAIEPASANMPYLTTSLRNTLSNIDKISTSLQTLVEPNSAAAEDVRRLIKESTATMRALRAMADTIERNPESLLYGKGRR